MDVGRCAGATELLNLMLDDVALLAANEEGHAGEDVAPEVSTDRAEGDGVHTT